MMLIEKNFNSTPMHNFEAKKIDKLCGNLLLDKQNTDIVRTSEKLALKLPIKKRFSSDHHSIIDGNIYNTCISSVYSLENDYKDEPIDYSLPTRKRALKKRKNNEEMDLQGGSLDIYRFNAQLETKKSLIKIGTDYALKTFIEQEQMDHVQRQMGFISLANWLLTSELLPFQGQLGLVNVAQNANLAYNLPTDSVSSTTPPSSHSSPRSINLEPDSAGLLFRPKTDNIIDFCNYDDDYSNDQETRYVINPVTGNKVRKSYKNMTLERRMEANARERTRVHTIGAAFDSLRKLIPTRNPDQKLSKLSILRIACSYILLLAAMNGLDYSAGSQGYTVEECVELVSETLACESKYRK